MLDQFSRTELIFGKEGMERLFAAKVAIFGLGGVGGYAAEALARSGVGGLDLYDDDRICVTNINRQLHATHKTVGMYKVDAARGRILEINPRAAVGAHKVFYGPDTAEGIDLAAYDYVIDAVDTVTAKIELAVRAAGAGVPAISCMGAGNKLDASAFEVADIYATSVCPLAAVMRRELRKRGVAALKVVYSKEKPAALKEGLLSECKTGCVCPPGTVRKCDKRRQIPGSNAFVPPVAGLILAGEVVKGIVGVP
jgi:tRNA A37 threonylcarbamoyladenosine dehydratase